MLANFIKIYRHIRIFNKFKDKKCVNSRNTLMNSIKADYYHTSGGAITKDTYDFGFLSLDEGYKEELDKKK